MAKKIKIAFPVLTSTDLESISTSDLVETAAALNRASILLDLCKNEIKRRAALDGVSVMTSPVATVTIYRIRPKKRLDTQEAERLLLAHKIDVPYIYTRESTGIRFK